MSRARRLLLDSVRVYSHAPDTSTRMAEARTPQRIFDETPALPAESVFRKTAGAPFGLDSGESGVYNGATFGVAEWLNS
jgi:hypothetical protein